MADDSPIAVHHDGESEEEHRAHVLADFQRAGAIAAAIKKDAKSLVMPGESVYDIAETIEKMITDAGAQWGFPCNISINDIAAHYTPETGDKSQVGEKDLVKIDFGVGINGCVADTAFSVDLSGEQDKLMEAARAAVEAGIAGIKPGATNGSIGSLIEHEIKSRGFKPIENLTGHMIEPFNLHAGVSIPNISSKESYEFQEGDVFAVEPFATNGAGHVADQPQVEIFSVVGEGRIRMRASRELLLKLVQKYFTLPFAERWVAKEAKSKLLFSASLKELLQSGCLHPYPVLREAGRGLVSQFEHTVIVEHDGAKIITGATDP
ncbi:MAG: type II methionyl aminopeptidase [Candidatus Micrarchaeota archaeon]|nr:type II methionyl aminopeptidase [Candidatus Micrarchaeota archaeon]